MKKNGLAKKYKGSIVFTNDPKYYVVGDTISISLSNGKVAVYKLVSIKKHEKESS